MTDTAPRRFPRLRLLAVCILLQAAAFGSASAQVCGDPLLQVEGASAETAARVCAAAEDAKVQLAQCGLTQTRRVTLDIRERIDGPAPHCAGLYRCGTDRVILLDPDLVATAMPEGSAFAPLPPDLYFRSLVVHEMSHALMDQAECRAADFCDADLEYVAYAMQLQSLPEEARAKVLDFRDVPEDPDPARLNDFLLWMKPDIFALYAWAHFSAPGNGCAFVGKLVSGEASLAMPVMEN